MFDLHPFLLITFFATIISWLIVLYCIAYLRRYGATTQVIALTASAFGASIWALFGMLTLTATTYETTMLAYKFRHIGAFGTLIPLLLYAFTFGPAKKWVTKTTTGILTLSLLPLFVLLITAPNQYLFIDPNLEAAGTFSVIDHGNRPIYTGYLFWAYLIDTFALGYIVYQTTIDETIPLRQTGIVVGSILITVGISIGQTADLLGLDTPGTILTPLALSLSMVGVGYATFRYDTFDAKSRARSRTIEEMQEGYLLINPDGQIIDNNRTASELLNGYDSPTGVEIERVIPNYPDNAPVEGDSTTTFETSLDYGETDAILETSASTLVQNGQLVGTLCVFRDITERKAYQRELQDQRDNLELLNAVVRHDIRNDLQLVTTYSELLANDESLAEDEREYIEKIRANAESATALTNKARNLTKVMTQTDADLEPVNLTRVLNETVRDVEDSVEKAQFTIEDGDRSCRVLADEMLAAVFRNILKNAVYHNDNPDPRVTISVRDDAETVQVAIADNGPGVPDEKKQEIFGKGDADLESGGTGLGLYLVNSLVTKYGGTVWVEDNEPEGAKFIVELSKAQ